MGDGFIYPEWDLANETTNYPFNERATLKAKDGTILLPGMFYDAILHPVGGDVGMYLTKIEVTNNDATLYVGTDKNKVLCSAVISFSNLGSTVPLLDAYGRPAGALMARAGHLGTLQAMGVGTHEFKREATEFVANVCLPMPEVGLRGIILDDGTVFAGNVWIVGDDGVLVRTDLSDLSSMRVDVVGEPLFRRRFFSQGSFPAAPWPVKKIRIVAPNQSVTFTTNYNNPLALDKSTNLMIFGNDGKTQKPILRISDTEQGLQVSVVGS